MNVFRLTRNSRSWVCTMVTVVLLGGQSPAVFAAKKDVRKKPSRSSGGEAFGPPDIAPISPQAADLGAGVHRDQEGVDTPYKIEVALASSAGFLKKEFKGSLIKPQDEELYDLISELYMIFGRVEVGAMVRYSSRVITARNVASDNKPDSEGALTFKAQDRTYSTGPVVKVNLANIDRALLVPYVLLGLSLIDVRSSTNLGQSSNRSGQELRGGVGLNIFVSSHVAFSPRLEYLRSETVGKGLDSGTDVESGLKVWLQIAAFL